MNEQEIIQEIKDHGPKRVVVNKQGAAKSWQKANEMGIVPEVVFVRDDFWTLGAPRFLEKVAESLWENNWTHVVRLALSKDGKAIDCEIQPYQRKQ